MRILNRYRLLNIMGQKYGSLCNAALWCLALVWIHLAFADLSLAARTAPVDEAAKKIVTQKPLNSAPVNTAPEPSQAAQSVLPEVRPGFGDTEEASHFDHICPTVHVEHVKSLRFSAMEKRLLCGDEIRDAIGTPWQVIPPNEAAFLIRSFLQSRGYHDCKFLQDGSKLYVLIGGLSHLKKFSVGGGPPKWEPPRKRLILDRPLTPGLLDELQAWSLTQVKNEGYACAKGDTQADPHLGEVFVHLTPGEPKRFMVLNTTGDTSLNAAALNRYNAFRLGDTYREYLVDLTRRRTLDDGFLQSIILSTRCQPDGVLINRDVLLGSSREVRVAFGGGTEQGPLIRATLRQNRIGASASSAQVQLNASYKQKTINEQDITANYKWYYTKGESRSFLQPALTFKHEASEKTEYRQAKFQLSQGYGIELESGSIDMTAGPVWLDFLRSRGTDQSGDIATKVKAPLVYISTSSRWRSHEFEYWNTSPRTGELLEANLDFTLASFAANYTAQRLQLKGEKLWSIGKYDPPLLILGARFNINSVFSVGDRERYLLPPEFLTLAGGDANLRGFSANTLPRGNIGALSAALGSFEARLHKVIFSRVDVFGFMDAGALGRSNFQLDWPFFISPGAGFRWESPVGALRVYAAEGMALNEVPSESDYGHKFRVGLTFGDEF